MDTCLGDVMMIKLVEWNEQDMRWLVEEIVAEPEMTKVGIITRSGRDAWIREEVMMTAWNRRRAERSDKED